MDMPVIRRRRERQAKRVPRARVLRARSNVATAVALVVVSSNFRVSLLFLRELSCSVFKADGGFLTRGGVGWHMIVFVCSYELAISVGIDAPLQSSQRIALGMTAADS